MFTLDDDDRTEGSKRSDQGINDLRREPLLNLGPSSEGVHQPGKFAQPRDESIRGGDVSDVGYAVERDQMMLAGRVEGYVLHDDEFFMAKVKRLVQHGEGVFVEAAVHFRRSAGDARGGLKQAGPVRVFANGQEEFPDGPFHPWTVNPWGGHRNRALAVTHGCLRVPARGGQ